MKKDILSQTPFTFGGAKPAAAGGLVFPTLKPAETGGVGAAGGAEGTEEEGEFITVGVFVLIGVKVGCRMIRKG